MIVMTVRRLLQAGMRIVLAAVMIGCLTVLAASGAADEPRTMTGTDEQRLAGRWVRQDGGYILELRDIKKDGRVSASYFNPRPIKVHQAAWRRAEGMLGVSVELRDINYPGSKYDLRYDQKTDRLKGTYFQAVERQTYNIEFVRVK